MKKDEYICFYTFELRSKVLPFDKTKRKPSFSFVLCSLNRTFALK